MTRNRVFRNPILTQNYIVVKSNYLLNPTFIVALTILFLNDHVFKWVFGSWVTGKLSDFSGVHVLSLFIACFLSGRRNLSILLTALFFIWWKSPFSDDFIEWYNQYAVVPIARVIDYSDYIALSILPISHHTLKKLEVKRLGKRQSHRWIYVILPLASLILMSTSPPKSFYYHFSNGNMECFKCTVSVPMSEEEIINYLRSLGLEVENDTLQEKDSSYLAQYWSNDHEWPFYKIQQLILESDTIRNFQFALEPMENTKTKIHINGMDVPRNIKEVDLRKKLVRHYRKMMINYLKGHLKA